MPESPNRDSQRAAATRLRWTSIDHSVRPLIERYALSPDSIIALVGTRYALGSIESAAEYDRVATLLARERTQREAPPSEVKVAPEHEAAVCALFAHYYRAIVVLRKMLICQYSNLPNPAETVDEAIQRSLIAFRRYWDTPTCCSWDDPLVEKGASYFRRHVSWRTRDLMRKGADVWHEEELDERTATARAHNSNFTVSYSRKLHACWKRFWDSCTGVQADTRDALIEAAHTFGHAGDEAALFAFFHAYLLSATDDGFPDTKWVKAQVELLLRAGSNTIDQRKNRLKRLWEQALAGA